LKTITSLCLVFACLSAQGQENKSKSNFTILTDKILFSTNNLLPGKADEEIMIPTKFQVFLPKNLITYKYSSTEFEFIYKNKQIIFIKTNWNKEINPRDTIYNISQNELEDFFDGSDWNFINPDKVKLKLTRCYIVMKSKYATILLYNIAEKNKDDYLSFAKSFKKI